MREILFRGQTRRYGEKVRMGDGAKVPSRWVYGGVMQGIGDFSIIYGGENENDPSEGLEKWPVYTDTVGQYTGLCDKNGQKIFEGDVVSTGTLRYLIRFRDGAFEVLRKVASVPMYAMVGTDIKYEVIGNIHDNPELLKGE